MVTEGQEMLVGVSRDPTFGPVITVGLGGIFVEVLKDVAFRLPPLGADEALEMVRELRGFPLLAGVRGQRATDIDALADCIARVSWLAVDLADLVAELDINPLRVLPKGRGVRVVDALVVRR
jgi:acetyltransferase